MRLGRRNPANPSDLPACILLFWPREVQRPIPLAMLIGFLERRRLRMPCSEGTVHAEARRDFGARKRARRAPLPRVLPQQRKGHGNTAVQCSVKIRSRVPRARARRRADLDGAPDGGGPGGVGSSPLARGNIAMAISPLKPSELREFLVGALDARTPALIFSSPGVGKTSLVSQVCAAANADCILMHPAVYEPIDFRGMPSVANGIADFIPFSDLKQLLDATRPTVCFLDDLGQATAAVQAAAMQLLLSRRINEHRISDDVVFFAATNRRNDRAGVKTFIEPLKSRFISLVELRADIDEWRTWAVNASVAPEVIAFLNLKPELLCDFQPTGDLKNSPTPRGWENVSKLLAFGLPPNVELSAIQGAIGEGAGIEFVAFRSLWANMVSPDLVLTTPDTATIPTDPSALCALATGLAWRVQKDTMTNYCRYLERICAANKGEFAALSMKTSLARDAMLSNTPGYIRAMAGQLGQVMLAA